MRNYLHKAVYIWVMLLTLLLAGNVCYAEEQTSPVSNTQWQQLTEDKAFGYRTEKELAEKKPVQSNFLGEFFYFLYSFFTSTSGKILMWVLFFIFITWTLFKVFFNGRFFALTAKKKDDRIDETAIETELLDIDWEKRMNAAIKDGNLTLAVKYSYLLLLQLLQQKELILFRSDKTNNDYYNELSDIYLRKPFRQLSHQYEYIWYGQYPLSQQQYDMYMATFADLKKRLHT